MKPLTSEWIGKADADLATAQREQAADEPNYDAVCFHAQQCAEKYVKAQLVESGVRPPRMHDLSVLANLLGPTDSLSSDLQPDLDWLTTLAVEIRYPGASANAEDAARAVAIAARIRAIARSSLVTN
ncbi:MAG TPA: HEPN domain-containing protein [Thermoanaerobaculia bacterium]|nr:HEPN domain-containing protein [Thermoanaerobaculia bacterium]